MAKHKQQLFTSLPSDFRLFAALTLTMPCWTCPSFDSLRRCPLTSESSWTTHSEDTSSPSVAPSYTDLQLINTEEQASGRASGTDSTGKPEFQARALSTSLLAHLGGVCFQVLPSPAPASFVCRMSTYVVVQFES